MSALGLQAAVEGEFALRWVSVGHACALDIEGGKWSQEDDDAGISCAHWASRTMDELRREP